jgi:hypothetical protein
MKESHLTAETILLTIGINNSTLIGTFDDAKRNMFGWLLLLNPGLNRPNRCDYNDEI